MASSANRSTVRPSRRHAPPEERRAQILEAALGCFSERGYHATTMDHIVAASGLSKGSLYWHFESKEDVFLALFDYIALDVFGRVDDAVEAGDVPFISLLQQELSLFFDRFGAERTLLLAWAEFLAHPRARQKMADIYRVSREKFATLIRRGIAAGELRDLPVDSVAAAMTGLLDALLLQAALDPDFDLRTHAGPLWEIVSHGVAVQSESGGAK
jgi:AcrR family transcriptional regulator